jgi:hypothetical protein
MTSLNPNYFQRLHLLMLSHWRLGLQHPNQRHQDSMHHVTNAYNATCGNSVTPEHACRMRWWCWCKMRKLKHNKDYGTSDWSCIATFLGTGDFATRSKSWALVHLVLSLPLHFYLHLWEGNLALSPWLSNLISELSVQRNCHLKIQNVTGKQRRHAGGSSVEPWVLNTQCFPSAGSSAEGVRAQAALGADGVWFQTQQVIP